MQPLSYSIHFKVKIGKSSPTLKVYGDMTNLGDLAQSYTPNSNYPTWESFMFSLRCEDISNTLPLA